MGKGEIARYEQFLLFQQRFQKTCFPGASKGVIVWEWINILFTNGNILNKSKFKAFGEDKFKLTHIAKYALYRAENIVRNTFEQLAKMKFFFFFFFEFFELNKDKNFVFINSTIFSHMCS